MVAHGQGITLIPEMAMASAPQIGDQHRAPSPPRYRSRTIGMAWRRNSSRQGICRAVAELLSAFGPGSGGGEVEGEQHPHGAE